MQKCTIFKNNKGGTAIMMTVLILTSILSTVLISNNIILNGLQMNTVQVHATKSFFAAEAGAERILYEVRKTPGFDLTTAPLNCSDGDAICFNNATVNASVNECRNYADSETCSNFNNIILGNGAGFSLNYNFNVATTTITSIGNANGTARQVKIKY